jgi:FlaA1/EpsC-like NDP-sugar epimerase
MTIPEAVQLVLQAGAIGRSGEVLILDMGEPVKIVDLAKDLILLSGLRYPDDIDIVFTGLRVGEKLSEELFYKSESGAKKVHEKIYSGISDEVPALPSILSDIRRLEEAACGPTRKTLETLQGVVARYSDRAWIPARLKAA